MKFHKYPQQSLRAGGCSIWVELSCNLRNSSDGGLVSRFAASLRAIAHMPSSIPLPVSADVSKYSAWLHSANSRPSSSVTFRKLDKSVLLAITNNDSFWFAPFSSSKQIVLRTRSLKAWISPNHNGLSRIKGFSCFGARTLGMGEKWRLTRWERRLTKSWERRLTRNLIF